MAPPTRVEVEVVAVETQGTTETGPSHHGEEDLPAGNPREVVLPEGEETEEITGAESSATLANNSDTKKETRSVRAR